MNCIIGDAMYVWAPYNVCMYVRSPYIHQCAKHVPPYIMNYSMSGLVQLIHELLHVTGPGHAYFCSE